jgi:hypothetical protein
MNLRTANNNRRRARRRQVYLEALAFHERRVAAGKDVRNSGYLRRRKRRD